MRKKIFCALFAAISVSLALSVYAFAAKIEIICPSQSERQLAQQRDFYVIGKIDRQQKSADVLPLDIEVTLYKEGEEEPIRYIQSEVGVDGVTYDNEFYLDYPSGSRYGTDDNKAFSLFAPPDLHYSGYDVESFMEPWRKISVREDYFAAVIYGGITRGFDTTYTDQYGAVYKDLTAGKYTLVVRALNVADKAEVCKASCELTFGEEYAKIIYRGSPRANVDNAKALAEETSSRMFTDPFPGYWGAASIFNTNETDVFYEIQPRWRANNAAEYQNGSVNAVLYNITDTSASQTVEIGNLIKNNRLDAATFYRYDIGEPNITFSVADTPVLKKGTLVKMAEDKKLEVTRIDMQPLGADKNEFKTHLDSVYPDLDVKNGVIVPSEKTFSIYGVVTPIAVKSNLVNETDSVFTVNNKIDRVSVEFFDGERILAASEGNVALKRYFADDYSQTARYEFRLNAKIPQSGTNKLLRAHVSAKDTLGNTVSGAEDDFFVYASLSGETYALDDDSAWYNAYCSYVQGMGYAIGAQTLNPTEPITRAQFVSLLNRTLGYAAQSDASFTDVSQGAWYENDLKTAAEVGVLMGNEKSQALPDDILSREEAIVMLGRALEFKETTKPYAFKDYDYISPWAKGMINTFAQKKIVEGYGGYVDAAADMSVAEATALMCKTIIASGESIEK